MGAAELAISGGMFTFALPAASGQIHGGGAGRARRGAGEGAASAQGGRLGPAEAGAQPRVDAGFCPGFWKAAARLGILGSPQAPPKPQSDERRRQGPGPI